MKIVVTGANGFIGSFVVERALARGIDVVGIVRESADIWRLEEIGFGSIRRISHYTDVREILNEEKPDVVVHLAAKVKKFHSYEDVYHLSDSIVSYTAVLLDAMRESGVRHLVYAGTSFEYGRDRMFQSTTDDLRPYDLYAALKLASEDVIKFYVDKYGINAAVLRPFFVFGYRDNPRKLLPYVIRLALKGSVDIDLTAGEQELDYVYVKDVADAFILASQRLWEGKLRGFSAFNVGRGETVRLRDMMGILQNILGTTLNIAWGKRQYADDEIMYLRADISASVNYLHWKPSYTIEEGLREMVNYYRKKVVG